MNKESTVSFRVMAMALCCLGGVAVPTARAGFEGLPEQSPQVVSRAEDVPAAVMRMRGAILATAASGDIEQMQVVLEMNELRPLIDGQNAPDQIARWKRASVDGTGRDVLALLAEVLEGPPARLRHERGDSYVWPHFADLPLQWLAPGQVVELYRLVPPNEAAAMLKTGRYSHYRLVIGGDGTWHSFARRDAD